MNSRLRSKASVSMEEAGPVRLQRMLRLRLPLIVGVFAALAVPGAAAVWKLFPPTYKATADVRFLASTPRVLGRDNDQNAVPYEKFLNTQVSLMTGNPVFAQVLADPDVRRIPAIADMEAPIEFLRQVVRAEVQSNSELVTISCALPDRDAAKLLVDKVLAAYMKYALTEEADTGGERLRVLMKERDDRQAELDGQLKHISELQQTVDVPAAGTAKDGSPKTSAYQDPHARAEEEASRSGSKVKLLTEQIAQAEGLLAKHKAAPGKPMFDLGVEDKVSVDPRVIAARQEFIKADTEFAGIAERYGEKSPQLEVERSKNNALRAKVAQTEQSVRGEVIASAKALLEKDLAAAKSEVEDAQSRNAGFEGLIEEERKRSMDATKTLAAIDELKIHAEETRTLLRAVRDEISSISVESNAPARVKLASPPSVPAYPSQGKRMQMLLILFMACGAAGVGAGFLRELTDQQIRSEEDLTAATDSLLQALIPHMAKGATERYGMITVAADRTDTAAGNEFRKILSRLAMPRARGDSSPAVNSCLITSPTWGDGKTTVACNLAIALAQADRRVLLMEVSSRGSLERALGMEPARGLTDILFRQQKLDATARATPYNGLFLLGAGQEPEKLAAKVASREMGDLLDHAMRGYDHVIIDTPPFLAVADARILAMMVDGVVLVAGAGVSTQAMVRQASDELRGTGARMIGVVLNRARSSEPHLPNVSVYVDPLSGEQRGQKPAIPVLSAQPVSLPAAAGKLSAGPAVGGVGIPKTANITSAGAGTAKPAGGAPGGTETKKTVNGIPYTEVRYIQGGE